MITGLGIIAVFRHLESEITDSMKRYVKKNKVDEDEAFTRLLNLFEERHSTKIPGFNANKRLEYVDNHFNIKQMQDLRDLSVEMAKKKPGK